MTAEIIKGFAVNDHGWGVFGRLLEDESCLTSQSSRCGPTARAADRQRSGVPGQTGRV